MISDDVPGAIAAGGESSSLATTIGGSGEEVPRTYPGGKNGDGVWQRIISHMPPHDRYIEAFLGSGAILRRKKLARSGNVGIDVDGAVIAAHRAAGSPGMTFLEADAVEWLASRMLTRRDLVYCDPPYLGDARSRPTRPIYRHEMLGEREHTAFLDVATSLRAMVMISGYPSALYDRRLAGWTRIDYMAQTRGGPKAEVLWMNFPAPSELHDYRFLGRDFRERERISRKIRRWSTRLAALPTLERNAILAALGDAGSDEGRGR